MTKRCFYCNDILTEADFALDIATMIMPQTYAHVGCIDGLGDGSVPMRKCHYCWRTLSDGMLADGRAVKIGRGRYAHTDCIDSHGEETMMNDEGQHILGAADSAHQGINLARSLLQESLGNMGEILMQGCADLGLASLGSAMRLGQKLKEASFLMADLLKDAHGLCVLLGHDLGACGDDPEPWADLDEGSHEGRGALLIKPAYDLPDSQEQGLSYEDHSLLMDVLASEDLGPGEDEFDDDEQPF